MVGYACEPTHVTDPSTEELRALQRVRQAMAAVPEADAEVKLVAFIYTEKHAITPKVIRTKEISVTVFGGANGYRIYFPAE